MNKLHLNLTNTHPFWIFTMGLHLFAVAFFFCSGEWYWSWLNSDQAATYFITPLASALGLLTVGFFFRNYKKSDSSQKTETILSIKILSVFLTLFTFLALVSVVIGSPLNTFFHTSLPWYLFGLELPALLYAVIYFYGTLAIVHVFWPAVMLVSILLLSFSLHTPALSFIKIFDKKPVAE